MQINCHAIARPRDNSIIGTQCYIRSTATLSTNNCGLNKLSIKNSLYQKEFTINSNIDVISESHIYAGLGSISFKKPAYDVLLFSSKVAEIQALFDRVCTYNTAMSVHSIPTSTKGRMRIMRKTALTLVKSTTISKTPEPLSLVITDYSQCVKKSKLSKTLKSIMIMEGAITPTSPLDTLSTLENLKKIYITNNCIDIIPESLGNIRLIEVTIINNKFGINFNWNWLNRKPIQNTLAKLDLSQNKINVFPKEILRCTKLHELRLQNNNIRRIPYGIHCLKSLSVLDVSENILEALPNSLERLELRTLTVSGNSLEDYDAKPIYVVNKKFPSLLLLSCRAVRRFRITYNDKMIPRSLVDTLKQAPICVCGKLTFYDYSAFGTMKLYCRALHTHYCETIYRNFVSQFLFSCSQKCLVDRCNGNVPRSVRCLLYNS